MNKLELCTGKHLSFEIPFDDFVSNSQNFASIVAGPKWLVIVGSVRNVERPRTLVYFKL